MICKANLSLVLRSATVHSTHLARPHSTVVARIMELANERGLTGDEAAVREAQTI